MEESFRIEEFRVGNYVAIDDLDCLAEVTKIKKDTIGSCIELKALVSGYNYGVAFEIKDIQPIPLTEELLEYALSDVFRRAECDYEYSPTEYEIPCEVLPGVFWHCELELGRR